MLKRFLVPFSETVDMLDESVETIDHVAVVTSNVLFFIVMFIFAVFETYVLH